MARVRLPDIPELSSWDDANQVLMEISEAEIRLAEIEGDMNIKINAVKEAAEAVSLPLKTRIAELGRQLKMFAEINRPDFGKSKSKALTFGELGWRVSTSVVVKPKLVEHIIGNLRKLGMEDCVKVTEAVNKEVLKTYPEDKIIACGASLKKDDTFWFETNKQSLKP